MSTTKVVTTKQQTTTPVLNVQAVNSPLVVTPSVPVQEYAKKVISAVRVVNPPVHNPAVVLGIIVLRGAV